MALHGRIHVNGHSIGLWEAIRVQEIDDSGFAIYDYKIALFEDKNDGPEVVWATEGTTAHLVERGPLVLTSLVLSLAAEEHRKYQDSEAIRKAVDNVNKS